MATDKSQAPRSNEFSFVGITAFLVVVALFVFVSTKAGTRGVGLSMVLGAIIQQFQGRIEYGWEARPPLGHITGWLATLLNVLFGGLGLAIVVWPEVAMDVFGWDKA